MPGSQGSSRRRPLSLTDRQLQAIHVALGVIRDNADGTLGGRTLQRCQEIHAKVHAELIHRALDFGLDELDVIVGRDPLTGERRIILRDG